MAYCQFRCGLPALVSSTLYPLIGEKGIRGWIGKLIDILATFATVFGVATSLGLGAIQINSGLNYVSGVPKADYVSVLIICVITVLFILSAVTGIRKGIKFFSQINMALVFFLMMVIVFGGPTKFILDNLTNTIGGYFQNIIQMSFWTDPYGVNPGWVGSWTIFYWAWWIAWAPFVGAFIARISRGRTVREFIWGVLIAPALYVEVNKGNIAPQVSKDVGVALFALLHNLSLPFPTLLCYIAIVLIAIFFITSADSATFVMSMLTSGGNLEPPSVVRIIWGVIEALVAIALLAAGGLTALQTASIASAFPFMLVMIVMCVAILKSFRQELGKGV
jgi:glycine betaine transporter